MSITHVKHERTGNPCGKQRQPSPPIDQRLTWFSGAIGRELRKPKWLLVTHMFNHQTHHRGQVHCLLTQLGAKPGDTDLGSMPD